MFVDTWVRSDSGPWYLHAMNLRAPLRWLAIALVALVVTIAWRAHESSSSSLRDLADTKASIGRLAPSTDDEEGRPADAIAQAHEQSERRAAARDLDRARRDALREHILEREQAIERPGRGEPDAAARNGDDAPAEAEAPTLTDRIGGRDALLAALQRDFMPLADECIAQATERTPELKGMLALELDLLADDELGAVIDRAAYPEHNEIADPELLECIRETALATTLPPPPEGGRESFMITMPLGDT